MLPDPVVALGVGEHDSLVGAEPFAGEGDGHGVGLVEREAHVGVVRVEAEHVVVRLDV